MFQWLTNEVRLKDFLWLFGWLLWKLSIWCLFVFFAIYGCFQYCRGSFLPTRQEFVVSDNVDHVCISSMCERSRVTNVSSTYPVQRFGRILGNKIFSSAYITASAGNPGMDEPDRCFLDLSVYLTVESEARVYAQIQLSELHAKPTAWSRTNSVCQNHLGYSSCLVPAIVVCRPIDNLSYSIHAGLENGQFAFLQYFS